MCWWNDITVHLQEMVLGENWWYASNFQITKSFTGKLSKMKEIEMWPTFMTPQESFNPRTTYQDAFLKEEFGEIKKIFQVKYDIFHCSDNFKHSNGQKLHNFFNKSDVMYVYKLPTKVFLYTAGKKIKNCNGYQHI